MAANIKQKEIQIQRPAQSLEAFQKKIASGDDIQAGALRPVLIGAGAVLVLVVGTLLFNSWRTSVVEKHETALAELVQAVQGDPPGAPGDVEKRMREKLPQLEALVKSAPGARKAAAEGLLNTWKLQLEGRNTAGLTLSDPWSRLRLAQRQVALAQGSEALATLAPLRKDADPSESWAQLFWTTQLEADRVMANRDQAWKDLAEYKRRFKDRAETSSLERVLASI